MSCYCGWFVLAHGRCRIVAGGRNGRALNMIPQPAYIAFESFWPRQTSYLQAPQGASSGEGTFLLESQNKYYKKCSNVWSRMARCDREPILSRNRPY